jgi:hypothetical protein
MLQFKNFSHKRYHLYAIQVLNAMESKKPKIEGHTVLWEFKGVFPKEVLGLNPK